MLYYVVLCNVVLCNIKLMCNVSYPSHEFTLLLSDPGLVPQSDLQHALSKLPPVDRHVHERLVPFRLQGLLHRFRSPFAFVTRRKDTISIKIMV